MNIKFSGPKEKTLKKYQTKEIGKYEHFLTEVTVSVHPFCNRAGYISPSNKANLKKLHKL